ncbi:MAG: ribonuclease H-like domain-containing protein [Lachnospiraceae bacterium]|nr:ribonuclease H-like domain-containing protein [Lachnospiraceae bacterium]
MEKIVKTFDINKQIKYPDDFRKYSKDGDVYLTIETTGLSPDRHRIISATAGKVVDGKIETLTFFSENDNDELAVIEHIIQEIKNASRLITWNGESFDLRFLQHRAETFAIKADFNSSFVKIQGSTTPSYDLSAMLRPVKRLLPDESLSVYSLLEDIGLCLSDETLPDGRTVVTLYKTYLATDEKKYAEPIIDHSVYKVTGIMNLTILLNCLKINKVRPVIEDMTQEKNLLTVSGKTDLFTPVKLSFSLPGTRLSFIGKSFTCSFDTIEDRIRIYYPDPASYVRLKENGSLIPKELSRSLPADSYEKVTRENCYTMSKLPEDPEKRKKQLENYLMQVVRM